MNDENLAMEVALILESADQAIATEDWAAANVLLKRGLKQLGSRYVSADTIDETGMKLVLADAAEKRGEPQNAARMRRNLLSTRLALLRKRLEASSTH